MLGSRNDGEASAALEEEEEVEVEVEGKEREEESSGVGIRCEASEEEKEMCRAFALLDVDGDGVVEGGDLEKLLISWGRMPMEEELEEIMSHANGSGCEGTKGMSYEEFKKYITKQLEKTADEEELRDAFRAFDSDPPTGKLNVAELRHHLKYEGKKLTDDEIDFLYREEDYWMLEEKNMFDYEEFISKILGKPTCKSKFLDC